MFSANQSPDRNQKDSVINAESTRRFGWSLATWDLREAVNLTAQQLDPSIDEFEHAGLEKSFGSVYKDLPLVKASPVRFECEYYATIRLPGNPPVGSADLVIGKVVGVHIEDWALDERGRVDVEKTKPIARMGYFEYAVISSREQVFEQIVPTGTADPKLHERLLAGMEGKVLDYNGSIKIGESSGESVEKEKEEKTEKPEKEEKAGELLLGQAEQQDR
jgi:flavin reductase (DIM6/NTAB) family NADH-FMN oxidoreductase RutF